MRPASSCASTPTTSCRSSSRIRRTLRRTGERPRWRSSTPSAGGSTHSWPGGGAGGTRPGVGELLKDKLPGVRLVAVEPAASPVLAGGRARPHAIQGIGASFVPGVLNRTIIDRIIAVRDEDALSWSRRLAREEGLLVGVSAGAAAFAACLVAGEMTSGQLVVTVLPATGGR